MLLINIKGFTFSWYLTLNWFLEHGLYYLVLTSNDIIKLKTEERKYSYFYNNTFILGFSLHIFIISVFIVSTYYCTNEL